jgi:hypothetical protein
MPGAFRDGADGWLQIQFRRMNLDFFGRRRGPETRDWMGGVGVAKLGAESQRWHAGRIGRVERFRIGHGAQQITHQMLEFDVGDQMGALLVGHRSTKHAREAEQRVTAARQTVRRAVCADQFTLNAECGGRGQN